MFCFQVKKFLSAYLDDELKEKTKEKMRNHLASCLKCEKEYQKLKEVSSLFSNLKKYSAPEGIWEKIESNLNTSFKFSYFNFLRKPVLIMLTSVLLFTTVYFGSQLYKKSPEISQEKTFSENIYLVSSLFYDKEYEEKIFEELVNKSFANF